MIQFARDLIAKNRARRNWKALPSDFERDAVAFVYRQIKPHFCPIRDIKTRIAASKALTFEELESALSFSGRK